MYPTKKLWEICDIKTWKKDVNYAADDWEYPFFTCWREVLKSPWFSFDTDAILIAWNWDVWACKKFKWKFEAYQRTYVLDNFQNIEKNFLFYFLDWNLKKELLNETLWSAIPYIKLWSLQNREIPLPPLPTQQKIVVKLDCLFEKLDQAITLTKQNLANIEELNKSALERIFKECEGKYEKRKIQDFSEVKSWKRLPKWEKVESSNTWYPYIRVTDFLDTWTINLNTVMYISEKNFNTICNYIITKDDLYISIAWTIWKTWIIPEELNWANLTENAVRLVYNDKDKIFNKYIYYFTLSENFKNQAWLATRAVAMPKLAISRLKQISIPLPPLPEQQKIVEYLDNIFAKNKILQEKYKQDLKNFEELKQSILKQAFEDKDFIK